MWIDIENQTLQIDYCYLDKEYRQIVKNLGFMWNSKERQWEHPNPESLSAYEIEIIRQIENNSA